jgi:hypothetical protein
VAAGASCTISIAFKPAAVGALTASLHIADNASGSPQAVALSGTGTATPPVASATPTALTFASTVEGVTTAAQVVTLKNTGGSALAITTGGITITGTYATSFTQTATTCGTTVAAGASCTISIAFKPAAVGALTASLHIADNASGSPQAVALSGTGTAPPLTVSLTPTSLVFPNTVLAASSQAQSVILKNTGTATVTLHSITITGTNATSFYQLNTCGATLASAASCTIFAVFKPTAAAALTAAISVSDTATGTPQTVAMSGTGTAAPTVTLSPATLTFASTLVGTTTAAQAVTVKNAGTSALNFTAITLTGTNPTSFRLANGCGSSLAAGASCTILVAQDAAAVGALKATLSIADNGSASPQAVTLTGTGH